MTQPLDSDTDMQHILALASLLVLTSQSLVSQAWPTADRMSASVSYPFSRNLPSGRESSTLRIGPGSSMSWRIREPRTPSTAAGSSSNPVTHQLPLDMVGFCGVATAGAPGTFIVTGSNSATGSGVMVVIALSGDAYSQRSISVLQSQPMGSFDPTTVLWNSSDTTLYFADYRTGALMAAQWDGLSALPQPASFETVPASGMSPGLGARFSHLQCSPLGGLLVHAPEPLIGNPIWVRKVAGIWETELPAPSSVPEEVAVICSDYVSSVYDIHVRCPLAGPVSVESITGSVVFSGIASSNGSLVTIPATTLLPSTPYRLRVSGQLLPVILRPSIRHATPSSNGTSFGLDVGRAHISASGPVLGDTQFAVSGWVSAFDFSAGPVNALVALGLGLDSPSSPTTQIGSLSLMSNLIWIAGPWLYNLTPSAPSASFMFVNPVTAASGLAPGMVPVYQWAAIAPDGAIYLSDVAGSPVR
jgi:hypothetical protein